MNNWQRVLVPVCGVLAVGAVFALAILILGGEREPETTGGTITFRRLSEAQITRSVREIFGHSIDVPGRFDPPRREEGLLAVGNSRVVVSRSGFEQAELRAREIAAQVMDEDRRTSFLTCDEPVDSDFSQACAAAFFEKYGKLLYRRPLSSGELDSLLAVVQDSTVLSGSFTKGIEAGISRLLVSPNFLFRVEEIDSDSVVEGVAFIDDYSLATRLSFLLWDAPPDEELLAAAERGDLRDGDLLQAQVSRMMTSDKYVQGVRAFFSDMFGYEQFNGLTKEQAIFPMYSSGLAEDAKEQSLRTILDLMVTRDGSYRELFTSKTTFVNRRLSALYGIPASEQAVTDWDTYTFADDDQRAGLFSLAAFLMLDPTHEGRTSPTIRGKSIRELYLCQHVPPPPPAVDFKLVQDTNNQEFKTARDRLKVHAEVPTCAGCHAITDPIGLALENYDAIGKYRTTENGAVIDAAGEFEGHNYSNAIELQQLLGQSASVTDCLTTRAYEYGVGRPLVAGERDWMRYLRTQFAKQQYRLGPLLRTIATSDAFRRVAVSSTNDVALSTH
ncbi:DUF1592 domain-containing protein [Aestuariicella hydrocarbonica]|uniref:DUF1592 domain-containing protein n=1 Tax=Pseudomaricurvus hydrocarbonicus TaxID=1470433 RepID=A0A9E5MMS8_9GAMM|nr:DUF1592 domain-containing protein [Aestuariicella hydrocarbonica]NHO67101.1 DUF1592 domain-containing protein [Aestuariicella hydrocarbonica]